MYEQRRNADRAADVLPHTDSDVGGHGDTDADRNPDPFGVELPGVVLAS